MAGSILVSFTVRPATRDRHLLPRSSSGLRVWRRFCRHRLAVAGLAILVVMTVMAAVGPLIWDVPVNEIDFGARLAGPSCVHPLGTDDLGQDLLARILYGGRISLAIGLTASIVAVIIGTAIGVVSASSGGSVDAALMWLTDLFFSLPQLPLLLLVIYLFGEPLKRMIGAEVSNFVLIISVVGGGRWMPVARVVRAQFLVLREAPFIEAARALGASEWRLLTRHLLPNAIGPLIVLGTTDVAIAILAESTLSFLGFGFPPDAPTWGRILYEARDYIDIAPHWVLSAGIAIFVTVLSVGFVGDGLHNALDPHEHNVG